jgi:quinol monooxygenase YgiN
MIVIAGTAHIHPEHEAEAWNAARQMMTDSEAEAGCVQYRIYKNPDVPGEFFIFEVWESEAALSAHFQTPHMAAFNSVLGRVLKGGTSIRRYEVSQSSDL